MRFFLIDFFQESIHIKQKKLVKLDFKIDEGQFVVSRPEDKSLANFLTSGSPESLIKSQAQKNES